MQKLWSTANIFLMDTKKIKYTRSLAQKAAFDSGARWIILCDTNGTLLPDEVSEIVSDVCKTVSGDHLGIHAHNDTGNAIANSLAAVQSGVRRDS